MQVVLHQHHSVRYTTDVKHYLSVHDIHFTVIIHNFSRGDNEQMTHGFAIWATLVQKPCDGFHLYTCSCRIIYVYLY